MLYSYARVGTHLVPQATPSPLTSLPALALKTASRPSVRWMPCCGAATPQRARPKKKDPPDGSLKQYGHIYPPGGSSRALTATALWKQLMAPRGGFILLPGGGPECLPHTLPGHGSHADRADRLPTLNDINELAALMQSWHMTEMGAYGTMVRRYAASVSGTSSGNTGCSALRDTGYSRGAVG